MFQKIYHIAQFGILNRVFSIATILLLVIQGWRMLRFRMRLGHWRFRLHMLEQEAREEGVVTVTDPTVLPPLDAYTRFWDTTPAMAIMFGLLGTFIGLTLSLSQIPTTGEVDAIQNALSQTIPSMGTAFWTSLCGLIVAISVRLTNAWMGVEFKAQVIDQLMMSEPQVLEGLETAAYQQGRGGALLRPHGIRELLWHQNRSLNQTMTRVAPQISEGIARGLSQVSQLIPQANQESQKAVVQELQKITNQIGAWHEQQQHHLDEQKRVLASQSQQVNELIQQQKHLTRVLSQELVGFQQQIKRMGQDPDQTSADHVGAHTTETPAIKPQTQDWDK